MMALHPSAQHGTLVVSLFRMHAIIVGVYGEWKQTVDHRVKERIDILPVC